MYELPKRGDKRRIWVHAVSVGEVVAATPILRELRATLPAHEILLSVTTSSGHQTAREKAAGLFDHLVYFPIDVARFQLAAIQRVRPDVVAIMETELWMNFLWAAKTFDVRTVLMNGRISDRSFPRSRKLRFFYQALLKDVDRCLMQSETDAERIRALGAREAEVLGNCKFDQAVEGLDADPEEWRRQLGLEPGRPVVVVGSIRAEEFAFLAQAIANFRTPHWIVAPRHLERTKELVDKLLSAEFTGDAPSASIGLRSEGKSGDVIILDTYGELAKVYSVADVTVVGGGFANLGGQNILQPLAHGKPVLYGKHMQNFRDVAAMATEAGAGAVCETPNALNTEIEKLLGDTAARTRMGIAAAELVRRNVGASRRYAEAIADEVVRGGKG
jgi:3-deoxy-D-manno-octulosonic-acid transferase